MRQTFVFSMCTGNSRLIGQNAAVHKTIYLELRTFCTDPLTHSVRHRAYINILGVKLQNKEYYYKKISLLFLSDNPGKKLMFGSKRVTHKSLNQGYLNSQK